MLVRSILFITGGCIRLEQKPAGNHQHYQEKYRQRRINLLSRQL